MDPRTPVVVGVGQITVRDGEPLEPLALMEAAARAAADDAGMGLEGLQSIVVVDAMSAPLGDPGAALAQRLGATPAETVRTGIGGNGPQTAVNDLATRIAADGLDFALIAGAEAMATLQTYGKRGEQVPWALSDDGAQATRQLGPDRAGTLDAESAGGLYAPIFIYPLFEQALRGAAGRTPEEHLDHISGFWSRFSDVAAANPNAWSQEAFTAEEIATVSGDNRRVSDPYNKRHNAHIGVDQGAALLLCSVAFAEAGGVPQDRWVFPVAGAGAADHWHVTERDELHRSPALRLCGEAVFEHAGDVELGPVNLYSCFPSAVQIAAAELGLPLDRQLTMTGGLAFFGGPGNNYATHGIAEVVTALREDPDAFGLATALGYYATKHAVGLYSGTPPETPFQAFDVQDQVDALPRRALAENHAGEATVESYTAIFERDGSAGMGVVVGRLGDGRRCAVKSHDPDALAELQASDPLGRTVTVTAPEGFAFT